MSAFILKLIALASMIIDHIGAVFPDTISIWFRVVGRLAFPIFVFLLAEGFRHTKSSRRFLIRLGFFAIISEPVFDLAFNNGIDFFADTNIFYTLFLGGVAICAFSRIMKSEEVSRMLGSQEKEQTTETRDAKPENKLTSCIFSSISKNDVLMVPLSAAVLVASFVAAGVLTTDYEAYGVAFILLMYAIPVKMIRLAAMAVMCVLQHDYVLQALSEGFIVPLPYVMMIPATVFPVLLVAYYNGRRGPGFKLAFYAAYPFHLALLYAALLVR